MIKIKLKGVIYIAVNKEERTDCLDCDYCDDCSGKCPIRDIKDLTGPWQNHLLKEE